MLVALPTGKEWKVRKVSLHLFVLLEVDSIILIPMNEGHVDFCTVLSELTGITVYGGVTIVQPVKWNASPLQGVYSSGTYAVRM